jgi:deoxyribonuclease-1
VRGRSRLGVWLTTIGGMSLWLTMNQPSIDPTSTSERSVENTGSARAAELPEIAEHYGITKRQLFEVVYADRRETFYCACRFDEAKRPDLAGCGYLPVRDGERAHRVEVEHVVPASWLGRGRRCWSEPICTDAKGRPFKGRACCLEVDEGFRRAYADLHNLVPAIGEVNEARQNWPFDIVPGEVRAFGRCDLEIDRATDRVEPREAIRGDIARIHLYMERVHGVDLAPDLRARMRSWHLADPPDALERTRDARIGNLQGTRNPLVTSPDAPGF